ncbi:MAG: TolC family protein [Spirochaetaceae bacterium]|jgi:outer membrane protein TolC|nr:TolC family protein [Spirochaetaceae bacterium]
MKTKIIVLFFVSIIINNAFSDLYTTGLSLQEAGEMAVAASKELQGEYTIHFLNEKSWFLGRSAYLPKIHLTAYEDERLSRMSADTFTKNYSIGLEQVIFDGGRLFSGRKIQKAKLAMEKNGLERKSQEIAEAAINAYRQILALRQALQIQENGYGALVEQRRILASEVSLGMVLDSDLAAADISIRESKIEIVTKKLELSEIEKQFMDMLGLERMPELKEQINLEYSASVPSVALVKSTSLARNPDLQTAKLAIDEKQEETKFAFLSWIPTLSANGKFGLTGTSYPLTRYNWSVGLSLQFSSPWLSGDTSVSTGFEGTHQQNFNLQGMAKPLPDPASSVNYSQVKTALDVEKAKYEIMFERLERSAEILVDKYTYIDQKRSLVIETRELAAEKLELTKLKHKLGLLTSIDLMEAQIEYTKKEIEVVQSVLNVLLAERELEKLMDMHPGELRKLVNSEKIF